MKLGAFAVIPDGDGRVLLVHRRDYDLWNLPGGGVEPGETPWEAVTREVREETGLDVAVIRLAIVDYRPERDELVFTFRCAVLGGAFAPNDEADRSGYFAPDALPPNTAPRHVERIHVERIHVERIQPAITDATGTLLRVQRGPATREWLRERGTQPPPRYNQEQAGHSGTRTGQRAARGRNGAESAVKLGAFATIGDAAGRVLLAQRRDGDFWMQPGGGIEAGETPWEAAVREVREETGLRVAVERLTGVYCWPEAGELIFSFAGTLAGGELGASDETRGAGFFPPDALPAATFAEHRERIADALAGRADTLLRIPTCISAPEEVRRWRERARTGEAR